MNLSYESQGEKVRKLQEALNSQDYGLAADGIYRANTKADVKKLTEQPGKKWAKVVETIIVVAVSAIVGFVLRGIA